MLAAAIAGAVIGVIGGALKAQAMETEFNETVKDLYKKRDQLNEQYNLTRTQAQARADQDIADLRANIADAKVSQGIGLRTSANNMALQDQIAGQQIAQLQVEASRQVGASVQNMALSGVRRMEGTDPITGKAVTANGQVFNTQTDTDRSIAIAEAQRNLSRFQNLENAKANYYNADRQIASYNRQINNTKAELARTLEKTDVMYRQQSDEINETIYYMRFGEGRRLKNMNQWAAILTGGMSGASSGISLYGQGKQYGLWGNES